MENKVVSLEELYNQLQSMLEEAGMGTWTLHLEISMKSYEHRKTNKYSKPDYTPEKSIRVWIHTDTGYPSITINHWSPTVVMETIKTEIQVRQLKVNPPDSVCNATISM